MKKYKVLSYILLGVCLSFYLQDILSKKTFASDSNDNKNHKVEENNRPNFIKASEQAIQAVVHIKSKYISNEIYGYYDPFYGKRFFNQPKENIANGSGVIISDDGYIITNKHVINNAEEIEVVLNDKRTYSAEILGEDSNSDLALLKIEENKLPFLKFDNSNNLRVGEWVLAVGNPYNLNSTVTAGIISAKSRKINILNDGGIESFIQTDAAINSGNSGGALVNTNGNLIGINTAIQSKTGSFSGYGFAIPSNMAEKIINDLKLFGEVRRAYIGIHITDINMQVQKELKLKGLKGVLISKVLENSAAELAGIKNLDVILEINGIKVNSTSELHEIIIQFNPGDEINCTIQREEQIETVTLSLKS
ncbi:MAG: trypsin-like peptidase domain-containing protein [Flavobacteriales bacterium]|nr:trypsin-like peptidase domain-containing protein [Flavobacteriales bacterium]